MGFASPCFGEHLLDPACVYSATSGRGGGAMRKMKAAGDAVEDSHRIPPSPVIHVRGLCDAVVEADLVEALDKFGNICYVMMMPFKRQALVEFDSVESAERCVNFLPSGTNLPNTTVSILHQFSPPRILSDLNFLVYLSLLYVARNLCSAHSILNSKQSHLLFGMFQGGATL
uniref:Heterogeneous nuclear ribonucleoprotein L-like n=1 Tax=Stegastes partitus TaxID=144197 RepID=A0A3B5BCJ9_9TELE